MPKSFKNIKDILGNEKDFQHVRSQVKKTTVIENFENIFPELKNVATVVRIENTVLFLRVENSVWRNELNFQKQKIIEKINHHLKNDLVKSIKFVA